MRYVFRQPQARAGCQQPFIPKVEKARINTGPAFLDISYCFNTLYV